MAIPDSRVEEDYLGNRTYSCKDPFEQLYLDEGVCMDYAEKKKKVGAE